MNLYGSSSSIVVMYGLVWFLMVYDSSLKSLLVPYVLYGPEWYVWSCMVDMVLNCQVWFCLVLCGPHVSVRPRLTPYGPLRCHTDPSGPVLASMVRYGPVGFNMV